ncbi:MAG: hypothetical protein HY284_02165 [Nitrospirae bacterium]|nr:hypothetical protein [Nitrospirota bacterium]
MRRFTRWLPLLILLPLWVGGLVLDRIAERALVATVEERLVVALHAYQAHLTAYLVDLEQDLQLVAQDAQRAADSRLSQLDRSFLSAHLPEVLRCALYDGQGRLVAHTGESGIPVHVRVPAGLKTARFEDPMTDAEGASFYDVLMPIEPRQSPSNAAFRGTLVCRVKNILSQATTEHREGLGLSGEVYLVSAKTHLMLTESRFIPNAIGRVKVDTIGVREALTMRNGVTPYPDYRGVPVIGTFLYLRDYDWVLLAEMDEAEALALMVRLRTAMGVVVGLVSVAAGFVGWWYGRRMGVLYADSRTAQSRAEDAVAALRRASDELEERVTHRTAELQQSNEALRVEIEERRQAEAALREARRELETNMQALKERVDELERFRNATVQREFRIKELKDEIERLKRPRET